MEAIFGLVIWALIAIAAAVANKKRREQMAAQGEESAVPGASVEAASPEAHPGEELGRLLRSLQRGLLSTPQEEPKRKQRRKRPKQQMAKAVPAAAAPPPPPPRHPPAESVPRPRRNRYRDALARAGSAGARQGVIWSEVLGTPKGLLDLDDTRR